MTTRLYYTDSYIRTFEAVVVACEPVSRGFAIRLDRTAFYPTSGGQPFDTGNLGSARVVDVIDDHDGISHVVTEPLESATTVRGEIDWDRRRDHMEQHTGQHILSAAFDRVCGVSTVGFHMGAEISTIDLAREVTAAEIAAAEVEANRVIRENRPIAVRIVTAEQAARLPLRRETDRAGDLRIVDIQDFDVSACGGTHVAATGEVGLVVATSRERVRAATRLSFLCGGRAIAAVQQLRETTSDVARALGVAPTDVAAQVARLQQTVRDTDRMLRRLRDEATEHRVAAWRDTAETIGRYRVVLRTDTTLDAGALKRVAQMLVSEPGRVVVLIGGGEPAVVVAARSTDVAFDAAAFITQAAGELGGRGGGRADLAQGGLNAGTDAIVAFARRVLTGG